MVAGPEQGSRPASPHRSRRTQNKDLADDPKTINETRDYLLDAQRLLAGTPSPDDFFNHMIRRYPDRLNVGPVWYSALALLS